ncbi:hypothetical protein [Halotia branconii]|uniref:Uncharacterized protein n=1 Tax=Halotia branconii CENA392 TaxID=1539056 RepID=A0AAJ6NT31_9CYAN|nr:hypothetical protein [Halotia branconii]WGV25974.1 hypothetical protein QI031_00160 [Halotia branconii CENA392]
MPLYNPPATFTIPNDTSSSTNKVTNSLNETASEIVPANVNRKGLTIFNTLTQNLYLDTVSTVSTNSYMAKIPAGAFYELPANKIYIGSFYGILATGTGSVEIREFV